VRRARPPWPGRETIAYDEPRSYFRQGRGRSDRQCKRHWRGDWIPLDTRGWPDPAEGPCSRRGAADAQQRGSTSAGGSWSTSSEGFPHSSRSPAAGQSSSRHARACDPAVEKTAWSVRPSGRTGSACSHARGPGRGSRALSSRVWGQLRRYLVQRLREDRCPPETAPAVAVTDVARRGLDGGECPQRGVLGQLRRRTMTDTPTT
jgi:hypothetical protein